MSEKIITGKPPALRLCRNPENAHIVILDLFQNLIKSISYETLKQVQGDKKGITTQPVCWRFTCDY